MTSSLMSCTWFLVHRYYVSKIDFKFVNSVFFTFFWRSYYIFNVNNANNVNAEKRPELWKTDRFAAMRQIWELFISSLNEYGSPSEYLSIEETMYPMRHQIAFRQYNPKKPRCYGLLWKYWMMPDYLYL